MTQRSTAPPRAAVAVACGALLGCLLAALLLPATPASHVSDVAQLLAAAAAAATTARYAGHTAPGRVRGAWALVSLACAAWAAGEVWWTWAAATADVVPFPSPADVGFLGFAVLAAAGLLLHPATGESSQWQRFLDGLMTAGAVGLVSWLTTLQAVSRANGGAGHLESLLLLAYPASDVLLVVLTVLLLTRTRGHRTALHLMSLGVLCLGLADSAFAYLQTAGDYDGGLVDLGWVGGFLLIALAGRSGRSAEPLPDPREASAVGAPSRLAQVLPYVPVVVALSVVVGFTMLGRPLTRGEMLVACLVVGCLLARQFLTVRDNVRLAGDLAARERQLRHQAFHDPLTGLANRSLFQDRLGHALALHARDARSLAVVFLDLDDFKAVNDSLGHLAGDELLVRVAERLTGTLRTGDTIARLGGDEFAVLLEDGGDPLGSAQRMADALRQPFAFGGQELTVRASIGVAALAAEDPTVTADQLLCRSDAAMYAAKRAGKGRIVGSREPVPAVS
ncbi:Diguanylate cyclase/phosphodiesterase (fragment) [Modestobacter italicus]|uniref:Diguanylate cyclase/phosphodiesterase n=1 Tax=Modestobacter italicus (strain DSM 44449 / CECT 9708 / BC 501) TaxID=2732864 RepID=I4EQK6_MODI5